MLQTVLAMRFDRLALVFLLIATGPLVRAVDLRELMVDTQRMEKSGNTLTLVWWIPTEYWDASLKDSPNATPAVQKAIKEAISSYIVLAVTRVTVTPLATLQAPPASEMTDNLDVMFGDKTVDIVPEDKLTPEVRSIDNMFKPVFASMLGQLGEHFELVFIKNATFDGKPIVTATGTTPLKVTFYGRTYTWKTPLPSLLPPRVDPKTGEQFPGTYNYNPYTGEKLAAGPTEAANKR